jgi:hypothetical protein
MEEVLEEIGAGATLVTIYPFDACPTEPPPAAGSIASPPAAGGPPAGGLPPSGGITRTRAADEGERAATVQLVDDPLDPVAEQWGRYPGSVFLIGSDGRITYKRTRLVRDEVVRLIRGG